MKLLEVKPQQWIQMFLPAFWCLLLLTWFKPPRLICEPALTNQDKYQSAGWLVRSQCFNTFGSGSQAGSPWRQVSLRLYILSPSSRCPQCVPLFQFNVTCDPSSCPITWIHARLSIMAKQLFWGSSWNVTSISFFIFYHKFFSSIVEKSTCGWTFSSYVLWHFSVTSVL